MSLSSNRAFSGKGFLAIDGTKGAALVGIMPGGLFFIGTGKTFSVTEAGTLFLRINDTLVSVHLKGPTSRPRFLM